MKKILLMAMILALTIGLLLVLANNKVPDQARKKKATPRPSVSISPYTIPLPQMGRGLDVEDAFTTLIHR